MLVRVLAAVLLLAASFAGAVRAAGTPPHAVVLIYHHVDTGTPASTSVAPAVFARHLDALAEGGHAVLGLAAIADSLRRGRPLPDLAVGLSFDDGYDSVYREAFPRLRDRGWPFTVFVCPAAVDAGRAGIVTWDQLREMAAHGATVANHGLHHEHLQRRREGETDAAWRERVRGDLLAAHDRIRAEIGRTEPLLAYPYGEYDPDLLDLVAELGWTGFGQQSGACGAGSDFALLPRFPMAGDFAALETFGDKVRSLPLPLAAVAPRDPRLPWPADDDDLRPELRLELPDDRPWRLAAFVSGGAGGEVVAAEEPGVYLVRATEPLGPGRSRYNVTAPSGIPGRFHWFSHVWIVGDAHAN